MSSMKLMPGTQFPSITIKTLDGSTVDLKTSDAYKLIVVYRGAFCPFCKLTLSDIQSRLDDIKNAGITEIIAISADKQDVAENFAKELGLTFTIGYGLEVSQMRTMGLYVSSPTHYIPQEHQFSEPAYFLLNPDNSIRYIDIGSAPFAARVNITYLLNGFGWVKQQEKENPNFKFVMWGSY